MGHCPHPTDPCWGFGEELRGTETPEAISPPPIGLVWAFRVQLWGTDPPPPPSITAPLLRFQSSVTGH